MFLWRWHVSLMFHIPWTLALLSLHLKKPSPPPFLTDSGIEIPSITPSRELEAFSSHRWVHLLHTSCSRLGGNSYNCVPSLDPAKLGQVLANSHVLALRRCWMLKFMYFFPVLQRIGPVFCTCSLAVCKVSLLPLSPGYAGPWSPHGSEVHRASGVPMGQLGDAQATCASSSLTGFLMGLRSV